MIDVQATNEKLRRRAARIVRELTGAEPRAAYLAHRVREEALEPAVLQHAWYFDAFVSAFVDGPGRLVAAWSAYVFDLKVIDGAVNGVATLVRDTGSTVRRIQTGFVRNYALAVAAGAVALFAFVVFRTA